jgi:hypothetical protein
MVTFVETASTASGEVLQVVGSIAQLGAWAPAAALALTQPSTNAAWTLTMTLPPGTYFEYKCARAASSRLLGLTELISDSYQDDKRRERYLGDGF